MNWTELTEECCNVQGCAMSSFPKTRITPAAKRLTYDLLKKREDVRRVALAVKKSYEANPNGTEEQVRKQAVKFITGGLIFFFVGSFLLNQVMTMALNWFLKRLYQPEQGK
jgi:hypothetical protein